MGRSALMWILVCAIATEAAALDIDACGQTVPKHETGVLQVDLDCPLDAPAIFLEDHATLELSSHTVMGGSFGVQCEDGCTVIGPGQVNGASNTAVKSGRRLRISDVSVSGATIGVFSPSAGRIEATNVVITNCALWGLDGGKVFATSVVVNGNGENGIQAIVLKGSNIEANGNGHHGIVAGRKVFATDVTANDNGGAGVYSERTSRIVGLTATGNAQPGFLGFKTVRLDNSTLADNDDDPEGEGIDLATGTSPYLRGSSCGRSTRYNRDVPGALVTPELGFSGTWSVCSED